MAPVDGRAQRLLARRRVTSAGTACAERRVEALRNLDGRKQPAAGGRELDRQREPIDPAANLRNRGGIPPAEVECRIVGPRALGEQLDGVTVRRRRL